MLKIHKTSLNDVILIEPPTNFEDFRGSYVEIYNQRLYNEAGISQEFIQDDISISRKYVLRGIHGDLKTWKLVTCLQGSFYIVVINNDPSSNQYKKWEGFTLSETKRQQILIPPKFGNGHLVMTETAIFHYKQTSEYNRNGQFTISWNDPEFNIWWPITNPLVSFRDKGIE
ncbi:dTDP-4-dehydrorhamnose 3,5-epimerase [Prochlorococcus marinus str. MIT 1342]|uniref:dTDP-4-dehydrorhamnose 3,5-epimerase family protein n=1 Tax=Prochlorococcus TaxID=1218 RepID=UPI0007B33298|nr:dTDP-4-dehydrorhamnose 3,5-epimerase family protein [Prochlorococcus marinus]KZR79932.1 dTDP-4-dehydrorhamnose 3,5-epimerase [Prochlorococcus marinus str. MIT 1342]